MAATKAPDDRFTRLVLDLHPTFPSYKPIGHSHIVDAEILKAMAEASSYNPDVYVLQEAGFRLQDAIVTSIYHYGDDFDTLDAFLDVERYPAFIWGSAGDIKKHPVVTRLRRAYNEHIEVTCGYAFNDDPLGSVKWDTWALFECPQGLRGPWKLMLLLKNACSPDFEGFLHAAANEGVGSDFDSGSLDYEHPDLDEWRLMQIPADGTRVRDEDIEREAIAIGAKMLGSTLWWNINLEPCRTREEVAKWMPQKTLGVHNVGYPLEAPRTRSSRRKARETKEDGDEHNGVMPVGSQGTRDSDCKQSDEAEGSNPAVDAEGIPEDGKSKPPPQDNVQESESKPVAATSKNEYQPSAGLATARDHDEDEPMPDLVDDNRPLPPRTTLTVRAEAVVSESQSSGPDRPLKASTSQQPTFVLGHATPQVAKAVQNPKPNVIDLECEEEQRQADQRQAGRRQRREAVLQSIQDKHIATVHIDSD